MPCWQCRNRILGRGCPLFELLEDRLPELRRIIVTMYRCTVLNRRFQQLLLTIGSEGNGTVYVAGVVATVYVVTWHYHPPE